MLVRGHPKLLHRQFGLATTIADEYHPCHVSRLAIRHLNRDVSWRVDLATAPWPGKDLDSLPQR